jgi:hypothetical protein
MNHGNRVNRYQTIMDREHLTTPALRILIENAAEAAIAKGVKNIGGMPPEQWRDLLVARVGREPIFRLLYILVRDMTVVKKNGPVVLSEVLVEDPTMWVDATKRLNLAEYLGTYPSGGGQVTQNGV